MAGRLLEGTGKQMETGRPSGAQTWVGGRRAEGKQPGYQKVAVRSV